MTATDVDKTAPSASAAQELVLLGPDPRAYLDIDRIIDKARQRGVVGIHPGWGLCLGRHPFPAALQGSRDYLHRRYRRGHEPAGQQGAGPRRCPQAGHSRRSRSDGAVDVANGPQAHQRNGPSHHAQGRRRGAAVAVSSPFTTRPSWKDAFFKASTMAQASFGNPRLFVEKFLADVPPHRNSGHCRHVRQCLCL